VFLSTCGFYRRQSPEAFLTRLPKHPLNRIPRATYRLQLRPGFGFKEVRQLVSYLRDLGISDLYLSPLFRARKDSSHGYDVIDHSAIESEFGSFANFQTMAREVRAQRMGILLDIVPNHMGINDPNNKWWHDVLENGRLSRYAKNFDIDWDRLAENLRDKILLPKLGDHFGKELEQGHLRVGYLSGRFHVSYFDSRFPLAPDTWPTILAPTAEQTSGDLAAKLRTTARQLESLPPRHDLSDEAIEHRYSVLEETVQRLQHIEAETPEFRHALEVAIATLNGTPGDPRSFDHLELLLHQQWYRLANWRAAADEINYRRFFDINDLAAIRVEDPEVFTAVHALADRLLQEGLITGLRVDHPDGLLDPSQYFDDLQCMFHQHAAASIEKLYVIVEKILTGEEPLPSSWPVSGTTGYELLNDINRLLVDGPGLEALRQGHEEITDVADSPAQLVYESKKQILAEAMSSELNMLAGRLHRLTQRHRMSRDFTFPALLRALGEVIACFPVYRTYAPPQGWKIDDADYGHVMTAIRGAKLRNPTIDWTTLDFIASVLLLQFPPADEPDREDFRDFVLRFQQLTGPVTAKGIEDTALYRYYPLAAMNEVGGELNSAAYTAEEFHRRMLHRADDWPHGLSATATHDTKRGEDTRARLLVLSEIAGEWLRTVRGWRRLNAPLKQRIHDAPVPSLNEEYLIYQTLVGTWPLETADDEARKCYAERITGYLQKALREAKLTTSWANPAEDYESAVLEFARELLNPRTSPQFFHEVAAFVAGIADAAFVNGLSQLVLKTTVPGVPDFYQGCELWDLNLVDPDNRRPVDYSLRQNWLADLRRSYADSPTELLNSLVEVWPNPLIKLFVTWRLLDARALLADAFMLGEYIPLTVRGNKAEHVLAFARRIETQWAVSVVGLHVQSILERSEAQQAMPVIDWQDTVIELPADAPQQWQSAFTQESIAVEVDGMLRSSRVLWPLPVALLVSSTNHEPDFTE
jgi:(1->4)-alpha-D-glucan 1-alpha-D-glucosylmutase